jgi:mannose-1-phosphate guanylyltransferase
MGVARSAMILCAGLGTRLRPLTEELAKPMVPVGDEPVVASVVRRVRRARPERIVVNVHHRPEDVEAWARGEAISVSRELELLGTAGGVARAKDLLGDGPVLVWNGDILSDLDAGALFDAHEANGPEATLAVVTRAAGQGNVGFTEDGRIVRLRKESFGSEAFGGEFVGIHVLGARLRAMLPALGCLVGDVYLPALRRGERLDVHRGDSRGFVDVGTLVAYVAANQAWLSARGVDSWTAPDASVSAAVSASVVGAGARIEAPVTRCIVWPGAHVPPGEAVTDAVVTRTGRVPVA